MTPMPPEVDIITAIFFDMNGTLRVREPYRETQEAVLARLQELLGYPEAALARWEDLVSRQKAYSTWARQASRQSSEEEIWTQWLLPEIPPDRIKPIAAKLMLAWSQRKGLTKPRPGADKTLRILKQRGYRLGLISNSMSTLDIPLFLKEFGWQEFFEVVVLSSVINIRKPAPEPFLEACRSMAVAPGQCAYLGNRVAKDLVGCKRAGFALGLLLEPDGGSRPEMVGEVFQPDLVLHSLEGLLEIFPGRLPG